MRRFITAAFFVALIGCGPAPSNDGSGASAANTRPSNEAMQARIVVLPAPYDEADYTLGRRAFAQCRGCHSLDPDGVARGQGPNLYGVFGRRAGTHESYLPRYSEALRESNVVWGPQELDHWIENPHAYIPRSNMPFVGERDAEDRRNIIAYLMVETAPAPDAEPTPEPAPSD